MTKYATANRARSSLDRRLKQLGPAERFQPPPKGWIRAIRDALGISATALGQRMGISGPAISSLERSERDETIRLDTLRRTAEAMNCTLVYAFLPKESLDKTLRSQAQQIARRQLESVVNTMALEGQAIFIEEDLVNERADLLIKTGQVWTAHS